ncbi:MAG TPA: cupin domain-containing protein [Acidothermaceae bacterium]|jgi:quercetin dioxygenase-like cupin family protein
MNRLSRRWIAVGAALAATTGILVASSPVQATPSTSTSKVLVQAPIRPLHVVAFNKTVSGQPWAALLATYGLTDGYVVENDFQPGQTTGWHSHPGPSLIFVVTGSVTNYESDQPHCKGVTYSAGTTLVDAGGTDVHELVNNGTTPAETIAVQFIPQGQPRRIDEPEPSSCHI